MLVISRHVAIFIYNLLLLLGVSGTAALRIDIVACISSLKLALPQQLALKGTPEYTKLNNAFLSARESEISPIAYMRPTSTEQVSLFLRVVKPFADLGVVKIAIRGAAQQPTHACSNVEGGITLDLGLLTGVKFQNGSVSIAAAERWGPVYEQLTAQGLAIAGGRGARSGVGGLSLSGGLSFFSSREGFVADNVLSYEVVTASGAIINANADENPDLFRALRGGSNNFGVVTRYVFRTFKQGPFWGGSVFYFPPSFPKQIEALVTELEKPNASKETHLSLSIGFSGQFGATMCQNQLYYTQNVHNPPVLGPFTAITPQIDQLNSMRELNLTSAASEQAGNASQPLRTSYMNTVVKADTATLKAAADIYTAAIEPLKTSAGLTCSLTLQPYPVSLLKKIPENGGNSLGLSAADGPLVSVLFLTSWSNRNDDDKIISTIKGALEAIEQDSRARGTAVDYKFLSYAAEFQDPIASYGPKNKEKLQSTSTKYDPTGVFQKAVQGGFKLFP